MPRLRLIFGGCLLPLLLLAGGCSIKYSFTGASISPDVETVTIETFQNIAPLVNASLSSTMTEALKERFNTQTRLTLRTYGGDLTFAGEITQYDVAPTAIQGNETAAMNRLTITLRVRYTNAKDEKAAFDRSFSHYADYPSTQQLTQVEADLVPEIVDKIVEDVFNAAVANW